MMQALNGREGGLQTVPLRGVLGAPLGDGDGVLEGCLVIPKSELLEGGAASKKLDGNVSGGVAKAQRIKLYIEDGAHKGLLVGLKCDARSGLDVLDFNVG